MSQEVELWFDGAPAPAAIALALLPFGRLHELRDGSLRLVEGDEPAAEGLPLVLIEVAQPPDEVRELLPRARAVLRCAAVLSPGRGFFLARLAAELQRRLGGVVYLPWSHEVFAEPEAFEQSWPGEHGDGGPHSH